MKTSNPAVKSSPREECGVWLDPVDLKIKAQKKRLVRPISKLLNPLARHGGYSLAVALNFTQTKIQMPVAKQSSISSFFTPQHRVVNKASAAPNRDPADSSPSTPTGRTSTSPLPTTAGRKRRRGTHPDLSGLYRTEAHVSVTRNRPEGAGGGCEWSTTSLRGNASAVRREPPLIPHFHVEHGPEEEEEEDEDEKREFSFASSAPEETPLPGERWSRDPWSASSSPQCSQRVTEPEGQDYITQPSKGQDYITQPSKGQDYITQPSKGQDYITQPSKGQDYITQPSKGQDYITQPSKGQDYITQPSKGQDYITQPPKGQCPVLTHQELLKVSPGNNPKPAFPESLLSEVGFGVRLGAEGRTSTQRSATTSWMSQEGEGKENDPPPSSTSPIKGAPLSPLKRAPPVKGAPLSPLKRAPPVKGAPLSPLKRAPPVKGATPQEHRGTEPSRSAPQKRVLRRPIGEPEAEEDSQAVWFTQDSEGCRVMAHPGHSPLSWSPLKDQTNTGWSRSSSRTAYVAVEEDEEEMLFTQDSEGNLVIKH